MAAVAVAEPQAASATLRLAATETVMAPAGVVDALRAAGVTYAQAFLTHMCRVSTYS